MSSEHRVAGQEFECASCTLALVRRCYQRVPWFRFFREPLVLGMRSLAWWHGIDTRLGRRGHPDCAGCVRYMKIELKKRSPLFVRLNDLINPIFNALRDRIVTPEEKNQAKEFATKSSDTSGVPSLEHIDGD